MYVYIILSNLIKKLKFHLVRKSTTIKIYYLTPRKPAYIMEYLLKYKSVTDVREINTVEKFLHVKTTQFGDFTQYTYSIATTKKGPTQFEDYIFSNYPILVNYIPRGFSIVVKDKQIVSVLEGPVKFSGITVVDEDPDDGADVVESVDTKKSETDDHARLMLWAKESNLEIVETEKANGKFAIFKIVQYEGLYYCHSGSKNKHLFFPCEEIDQYISSLATGKIVSSILSDTKVNSLPLSNPELLEYFAQGYSLCGELCDGEHFMVGDNQVHWFGLFKGGFSMDTEKCFDFMTRTCGLKTVPSYKVYGVESKCEDLDKVFLASRCKMTEGSVLRCKNTKSGEIILIKTKSVSYITKRFMRQSILKGYMHMVDSVTKRFIDAQEYHGLNTNASIRMCNQLIKFGFWLMNKEYPVSTLGVQAINAIKGMLPNGFSKYWEIFLSETEEHEQSFVPDDFGFFDKKIFLKNVQPYELRTGKNPVLVVFFQGLQGSGKSTLAQYIQSNLKGKNKVAIVEQDRFYGCTLSAQGYMFHCIRNKSACDIILVSRCNVSGTQYARYVEICRKLPTKVIFISPESVDELYLSVCMSGVFNRSSSGDKLLVGRKEYSVEESAKFIVQNYRDFRSADSSFKISIHKKSDKLLEEAKIKLAECTADNHSPLTDWIQTNQKELHDMRYSINAISEQIMSIIYSVLDKEEI